MFSLMSQFAEMMPVLLSGAWVSVKLFVATLVLALPLGFPIMLGENSRFLPARWFCKLYVFVFRGTPLLLQLMFFYFFFPIVLDIQISAFAASVLSFVLNYAAYLAEIYRGGMNSIDRGQYEAAHSLGLSKAQTLFGIIVPQMLRVVMPPVGNECIVLVKDTALVYTIGVVELMKRTYEISNREVTMIPYLFAAVIYLAITFLLTMGLRKIESHYSRYDEQEG